MSRASVDWSSRTAPSLADFEAIARTAFDGLPEEIRALAGELQIRIEEFAADEVLDDLGIASEYGLMGLYQGISLDRRTQSTLPTLPDMVFLYRRPILDYWAEHGETLGHLVAHVLIHEIGHHFGQSTRSWKRSRRRPGR